MLTTIPGDDVVERYLSRARELRACAAESGDSESRRLFCNAAKAYEDLAVWKPPVATCGSQDVNFDFRRLLSDFHA
jgi:hypothetical protein